MNQTIRSLFPVTEKYIYMNHAAVSPLSTRVRDAMLALVEDVTVNGSANYEDWGRTYEETRQSAARLVNARAHEIGFMRNTSDGLSAVANGIDWREGDNVVTCNVEFPSNMYPWLRLKHAFGVNLKLAQERNGRIDTDDLLSLIGDRARVGTTGGGQSGRAYPRILRGIEKSSRGGNLFFLIGGI